MAEEFDYEIVKLSENLIDNLGLAKPASTKNYQDLLSSDDFYIDVYRALMAKAGTVQFDRSKFDKETRGCSPGERIQSLINKLANEVLQVDLSHIKGDKIAKGNKKNISDMLQLLDALWHNLNQDGDTGAEDGEEEQMVEHIDSDINRHESFNQEQELNRASNSEYRKNDKAHQKPAHDAMFAKMMQDGKMAPGAIPVYSEDPINYGGIELQPKYNKRQARGKKPQAAQRPPSQKKPAARTKSAGLASKKQEVVRRIESNIYGLRRDKLAREAKLIKPQVAAAHEDRLSQPESRQRVPAPREARRWTRVRRGARGPGRLADSRTPRREARAERRARKPAEQKAAVQERAPGLHHAQQEGMPR